MSDALGYPGLPLPDEEDGGYPVEGLSPEVMAALQSGADMGFSAPLPDTPPGLEPVPEPRPLSATDRIALALSALPPPPVSRGGRGAFGPALLYGLAQGFSRARGGELAQRGADYESRAQQARQSNLARWQALNQERRDRNMAARAFMLAKTKDTTERAVAGYRVTAEDVKKKPELVAYLGKMLPFSTAQDYGLVPKPPAATSADDLAPNLTPEGLDVVATLFAKTGQMVPMGMGKAGVKVREQIINRAAVIAPSLDVASNQADFRANQRSLAALQSNLDAVTAFKNTAIANTDIVLDRARSIPDTGSPWTNQLARLVANKALGSADVTAFNTALQVATPEWARILSNPALSGVALTDAARKDIQSVMSGNFTRKQLDSAVKVLHQDADNRSRFYQQQIDAIKQRIGRSVIGSGVIQAPASAAPAAPPSGNAGKVHVRRLSDGTTGWLLPAEVDARYQVIP